jgi:hypothetical protein
MSPVSSVCSLSPILCSLSHVFVPCFLSTVPCLTFLFLVSYPLFLSHFSVSCFPSFVSHPLFHVSLVSLLCSLSSVLCSRSHFFVPCIPSSLLNLTSLFLVSLSLSPILSLCSLCPILLSKQFVALNWFRVCSEWDETVSEYAECAMKSFPRMLSMCMLYSFRKLPKNIKLKWKISTMKNWNFESRLGTHLIGPKWTFWRKNLFDSSPKKVCSRMSHRENVGTSNSGENRRKRSIFFENWPRA